MSEQTQDVELVVLDGSDGTRYAIPKAVIEQYAVTEEGRDRLDELADAEVSGFNLSSFEMVGIGVINGRTASPTFYKLTSPNPGGDLFHKFS